MHTHPHAELLFTLSGHGNIFLPDRKLVEACEQGHVLALPPACVHQSSWSILTGNESWRVMVVNFDIVIDLAQVLVELGDTVDLAFSPFYEWFFIRQGEGFKMDGAARDTVMGIMNEIALSLTARQYGVCSEIVAGLIRAISLFSRQIRQLGLADGTHVTPSMISREAALLKARSLMEHSGFFDSGCVARVARAIGMSEAHFVREFKKCYGTTPKQYSNDVLMRRCAVLLSRTDITVKDASYHLGFTDPSSFSRSFTRYHGMTPSEFQKRAALNPKTGD